MNLRSGKKLNNNMESSPNPKITPSRRNNESTYTLGMPITVEDISVSAPAYADMNDLENTKAPVVMTTSFIRQLIDLGIHGIMYQVSRQLADIVKPMVHNEVQQARNAETRRGQQGEHSASSELPGGNGQTQHAHVNQAWQPQPNVVQIGPFQA